MKMHAAHTVTCMHGACMYTQAHTHTHSCILHVQTHSTCKEEVVTFKQTKQHELEGRMLFCLGNVLYVTPSNPMTHSLSIYVWLLSNILQLHYSSYVQLVMYVL